MPLLDDDPPPEPERSPAPAAPCPRCEPLPEEPGPFPWEGATCPTCGRRLPLPLGLPGGTVFTLLLSARMLGETIHEAWQTARDVIEDERLRTNLLAPIDPETPDAYISMSKAYVPDPVTPAVRRVVELEQAEGNVPVRRLLFALGRRRAVLTAILRETWSAGFQRDEARVAARLGLPLRTVASAVKGKRIVRV